MLLVVKIGGGAAVATANILDELTLSIKAEQRVVLLHGGSDLTNKLSQRLGYPVRMVTSPGGMTSRYTDSETLRIYAMATAGQINTELVALLQQRGVNALGLAGVCSSVESMPSAWQELTGGSYWRGASLLYVR